MCKDTVHTKKIHVKMPLSIWNIQEKTPQITIFSFFFLPHWKMTGLTLICLFIAVDWAARTKPSNSAPLKFFVSTASSAMSTSSASSWCSRILTVWIWRIWNRPFSSGKPGMLQWVHVNQCFSTAAAKPSLLLGGPVSKALSHYKQSPHVSRIFLNAYI